MDLSETRENPPRPRQTFGQPILCTLRGTRAERAALHKRAHQAECSLNTYIRRQLGLPDRPASEDA